jgi:hypothetical protein
MGASSKEEEAPPILGANLNVALWRFKQRETILICQRR